MHKIAPLAALLSATLTFGVTPCATAQEILLQVVGRAGGLETSVVRFGYSEAAQDGIDPLDAAEPPPAPGTQVSMSFRIPNCPPEFPNRWRKDVRSLSGWTRGGQIWELEMDSSLPTVHLDFATLSVTPNVGVGDIRIIDGDTETTVTVPGSYDVAIDGASQTVWIVFPLNGAVTTEWNTWGRVKAAYRP